MSDASPANFELSIVLPLGVIANQLLKVEAELRFLNAKTAALAGEAAGAGMTDQAAARLERIGEALEAIRTLVTDIEADIQPRPAGAKSKARSDRDD
jgi:hypothetical protein